MRKFFGAITISALCMTFPSAFSQQGEQCAIAASSWGEVNLGLSQFADQSTGGTATKCSEALSLLSRTRIEDRPYIFEEVAMLGPAHTVIKYGLDKSIARIEILVETQTAQGSEQDIIICTGWLFNMSTIATAAHCLPTSNRWRDHDWVEGIARFDLAKKPLRGEEILFKLKKPDEYTNEQRRDLADGHVADFALLNIDFDQSELKEVPATIRPLSIATEAAALEATTNSNNSVMVFGYPLIWPPYLRVDYDCRTLGTNPSDEMEFLYRNCDAIEGYSGSPVVLPSGPDDRPTVIGIHRGHVRLDTERRGNPVTKVQMIYNMGLLPDGYYSPAHVEEEVAPTEGIANSFADAVARFDNTSNAIFGIGRASATRQLEDSAIYFAGEGVEPSRLVELAWSIGGEKAVQALPVSDLYNSFNAKVAVTEHRDFERDLSRLLLVNSIDPSLEQADRRNRLSSLVALGADPNAVLEGDRLIVKASRLQDFSFEQFSDLVRVGSDLSLAENYFSSKTVSSSLLETPLAQNSFIASSVLEALSEDRDVYFQDDYLTRLGIVRTESLDQSMMIPQ